MKMSPAASTATPVGIVELGLGGRSTVAAVTAGETGGAGARDGDDVADGHAESGRDALRLDDLADHLVVLVGDEDVARRVERHARGLSSSALVAGPPSPL